MKLIIPKRANANGSGKIHVVLNADDPKNNTLCKDKFPGGVLVTEGLPTCKLCNVALITALVKGEEQPIPYAKKG